MPNQAEVRTIKDINDTPIYPVTRADAVYATDGESLETKLANGLSVIYGDAAGTACEGNDPRLSDARKPIAALEMNENTLSLKSGEEILSSVTIEGGGATSVLNITTADSKFYNLPLTVTLEGGETISTSFNASGNATAKLKFLGQYVVSVTHEGKIYNRKVENKVLGSILNVEINPYTVYGFHWDGQNSDPDSAITYLSGYVNENYRSAKMNYGSTFDYGDWENAFFMPRPCLLAQDGTVFKYLNPNDYTKEAETNEDVTSYLNGTTGTYNAMIEWGKDDRIIYYKIVPTGSSATSGADVFIADYPIDDNYKAYPFYGEDGNLKEHFYTPIYNGSVKNNVLRSISGQSILNNVAANAEINYAKANGAGWNTETLSQRILINLLLVLIGKNLNTQKIFGNGHYTGGSQASHLLRTGTMDNRGMFYGTNSTGAGVKVFGMENWWGNQWRRIAGYINANGTQKIKLTPTTVDGSTTNGYNLDGSGYISIGATPGGTSGGFTSVMTFNQYGAFNTTAAGSDSTYVCDGLWYNNGQVNYAFVGGNCSAGLRDGAFCVGLHLSASDTNWHAGAALSYCN